MLVIKARKLDADVSDAGCSAKYFSEFAVKTNSCRVELWIDFSDGDKNDELFDTLAGDRE